MAKVFRRSRKRQIKEKTRHIKTVAVQGATVEGVQGQVQIESLLTVTRLNDSIPGTSNAFKSYEAQVTETYKKYNARTMNQLPIGSYFRKKGG